MDKVLKIHFIVTLKNVNNLFTNENKIAITENKNFLYISDSK